MNIMVMGTGKVAESLLMRISESSCVNLFVSGRNEERLTYLSKKFHTHITYPQNFLQIPLDLVFLAVNDDVISEKAKFFFDCSAVVCHLSGAAPLNSIPEKLKHRAVFYPLQTFARPQGVNWDEIPVFTQFSSERSKLILEHFSKIIRVNTYPTSDEERIKIHLCAVWINNFTRLIHLKAKMLCQEWKLNFTYFLPLILETHTIISETVEDLPLTGPAARGDFKTLQNHFECLDSNPEDLELYKILSQYIYRLTKDKSVKS